PTAPEPARAHRKPERSDRRHNDPKPPLRSSDASRSRRCSKAELKTGVWSGPGPELVQAAKRIQQTPAYAARRAAPVPEQPGSNEIRVLTLAIQRLHRPRSVRFPS